MEFLLDSVEYGVAEFYETYCHQIPMLVMITAGYCSDFMAETFDRGQILRIHTCTQQKRVVARQTGNVREFLISIPFNYPIKFCLPKSFGKVKREQCLQEIVETGSLPMVVQFVKGHEFYLGSKKVTTDSLPALKLIDTFEETCILGNTVNEGTLDHNLIPIPLYLKDLRLCRIVGFEGKSKLNNWDDFLKELEKQSTQLIYDQTYGNEDIAVYNQKDLHSVSQYEYLQPDIYSDLSSLYDTLNSAKNTNHILEAAVPKSPVVLTNVRKTDAHANTKLRPMSVQEIKSRSAAGIRPMSTSETAIIDQLKTALKIGASQMEDVKPPPVYPKPTAHSPGQSQGALYLPARKKKIPTPQNEFETTFKGDNSSDLESHNIINPKRGTPRTFYEELPDPSLTVSKGNTSNEISGEATTVSQVDGTSDKTANPVVKEKEQSFGHVTEVYDLPSQVPESQVSKMTIEQVGQSLKVLGLNHYVDSFKHNGVDGLILVEFDESLLVEELGFKKLEAIKLMQFVRKGHIPK